MTPKTTTQELISRAGASAPASIVSARLQLGISAIPVTLALRIPVCSWRERSPTVDRTTIGFPHTASRGVWKTGNRAAGERRATTDDAGECNKPWPP